jgi:hypothetical protein
MDTESETFALLVFSELPGVGERTLAHVQQVARRQHRPLHEALSLPALVLKEEFRLPHAAIVRLTDRHHEHDNHCRTTLERLVERR